MTGQLLWQRWLAGGAVATALLLGLSGAVAVPFLVPLALVGVAMLASPRPRHPLSPWAENLLAPLVLVAALAAGGLRFGVMRPVANLLSLLAAVRLWGGAERPRRAVAFLLLAVLNVAGIASSTHPALVAYLVLLLVAVTVATGQLLPLELARGLGSPPPPGRPPARLVAFTVLVALVAAVPLFVVFPRLRSPFAAAGVGGRPVSGFREAVALHQLGDIKTSRRPVLRVRFEEPEKVQPSWLRFAGATLSHYRAGRWVEGRRQEREGLGSLAVPGGEVRAELTLEQASDRLFVPPGTQHVVPPDAQVWVDNAEAIRIPRSLDPPVTYSVGFDPAAVNTRPPGAGDLAVTVNRHALERLAKEATAGARDPLSRAQAIERFLQTRYRYSTNTAAPLRADPVEWFLFTSREGHCEFFASAMVLLLRVEGIPARLQTGFAGGQELGAGEYLLRDANAHAWVLAYVGGRWRVFDPTPPEGRPGVETGVGGLNLRAWLANLESFWDRWIITFSLADQLEVLSAFLQLLHHAGRYVPWAGGAVALGLLAWLLARSRKTWRPGIEVSELGRLLFRLGREGGWDEDALVRATPSQVLASLLPALSSSRAACVFLFQAHERAVYGGQSTVPRRRVATSFREVLAELKRGAKATARTTSGRGPSSKAGKG